MTHITLDHSHTSTLALCQCGWRAARWTKEQAWDAAEDHCRAAHDDARAAQACRDKSWQIGNRRRNRR